jgi:hypothetical protein
MLKHLIIGATYQCNGPLGLRCFVPQIVDGQVLLVHSSTDGSPDRLTTIDLTENEWASIDFVDGSPLLVGRQYLVLISGEWRLATWKSDACRVDRPVQYFFSSGAVGFGAVVEKAVLVPEPEESDLWIEVPSTLPALGQQVLHIDKDYPIVAMSVYDYRSSRRIQGLNGPCFGTDNPANMVRCWMPIERLVSA